MSATDELRRLLDERGVEYIDYCDTTSWLDGSHVARADEYEDQLLVERVMTPEQAIAATLGNDGLERSKNGVAERGTCKEVYLLMAMDIGDGKDEVLGVYATESAAMEAAKTDGNQFGYAFHNVCKWEVVE